MQIQNIHEVPKVAEVLQYPKIFSKIDKNFVKTCLNAIGIDRLEKWFYQTIYNNTQFDFCRYFPKLSVLLKKDNQFYQMIESILLNSSNPIKIRFFAYYIFYSHLRLQKDYSKAKRLMEEYYDLFQDEIMYQATRSMAFK